MNTPEQDLIDDFVRMLSRCNDGDLKPQAVINANCKSKRFADVEFVSVSGVHWVIEAKSNDSKDKHNSVHKVFGELLKETGRQNRDNCSYGILLPEVGVDFYQRKFREIEKSRYLMFGELLPVESIFVCGNDGVDRFSWGSFCHP